MTVKLTPEQAITKSLVAIMRSKTWGFLGGILKTGGITPDESITTAATDGVRIMYNPQFIARLEPAEVTFLLLHEGMHKAYRHMTLWRGLHKIDPLLCNMAMDHVINLELTNTRSDIQLKFIEGGCLDQKYNGWDTPAIFRDLQKKGQKPKGRPIDTHIMEGDQGLGQEAADLDTAIRQAAGQMPSAKARALQAAGSKPRPWNELLRDTFASTVPSGRDDQSWGRINPVYLSMGFYLPGTVSSVARSVKFCIDTSGSIGQQEIAMAAAELANLCTTYPPEALDVIWWDTSASAQPIPPTDYASVKDVLKPVGGGGTDPECLNELVSSDDFMVVLTDGWFSDYTPPSPDRTVFILIPGGTDRYIKAGKVVQM